ncbi:hypothetical protein ACN27F_01015 [Solwaraspora sp. WMMB335]|uniref:hypothetical protein n=1 Tax=Solwaraspora sp. WMMB335 TaxID=3404118 RepID=UPI003B9492D1
MGAMPAHPDPAARPERVTSTPADPARRATRTRWSPVADLSPLARALLSDDLGGRDVVPRHVAARVTAEAEQWAGEGFTEQTVRPWRDLPPAAAGYLARNQVDPRVLDLPIDIVAGTPAVPLRIAIVTGRLPAERAYQLLVLTGEHTPPGSTTSSTAPGSRPDRDTPPRPVTPVLFSHANVEDLSRSDQA